MTAGAVAGADVLSPDLVQRVRRRLAQGGGAPTPAGVAAALRMELDAPVGDAGLLAALARVQSELVGAGPLEPLLRDPQVSDVLVNGPEQVWVDRGEGLVRAAVRFQDEAAVRRLAQRLAASAGRRLDEAQPWVDARLADGTRLHAVLPPIVPAGTCLSLRVFRQRSFELEELIAAGSVQPAAGVLLRAIVRARLAFLVSGGTGTGKTTLLSTLLGLIHPAERLVIVEDAGELRPAHPHVVGLEARSANVEGAGEVTLRQLVRQALRMRPDRIVVGEVRGAEVVDLLSALNTGHDGGCGTVHANSAADVPARLEALAAQGGLGRAALHSQLAAAVQCLVHLRRTAGRRELTEICLLSPHDGRMTAVPAWRRDGGPAPGASALRQLLESRGVGDCPP